MGIFDWLFGGKKTTPISVKKETETSDFAEEVEVKDLLEPITIIDDSVKENESVFIHREIKKNKVTGQEKPLKSVKINVETKDVFDRVEKAMPKADNLAIKGTQF